MSTSRTEPAITTSFPSSRIANVVGVGMVGASVSGALRKHGWTVFGSDENVERAQTAMRLGFIDQVGVEPGASVSFVATPVDVVADVVESLLVHGHVVTDVASVKESICRHIDDPMFVGGHPMAGSEKSGPENAVPELFEGATWVLTPTESTRTSALETVKAVAEELGATTVTTTPKDHDLAVATVSHVPHLVSSALMSLATTDDANSSHLRLAAGGFRDMTRIAAGSADLWTGITLGNRDAIVQQLTKLIDELGSLRSMIEGSQGQDVRSFLDAAATTRRLLPERSGRPAELSVVWIVVPDRPGALGSILGVFGDLKINVEDFEITHDESNKRGYLEVTIDASQADRAVERLFEDGFVVGSENL